MVDADFGQTDFGHPYLTDFGRSDFGQTVWPKKIDRLWPNRLWPKLVSQSLWPNHKQDLFQKNKKNKHGAPKGGAPKPPGLHTTAREPKRAHFRIPAFENTTKIQREDTQRDTKRTTWEREREREKKTRNFGRSGGGWSDGVQTHNHTNTNTARNGGWKREQVCLKGGGAKGPRRVGAPSPGLGVQV